MTLPPSKRPLKRFGQNFLTSPALQKKIVSALNITPQDFIVEIGPGKGALSQYIMAAKPRRLWAVEIDRRWTGFLQERLSGPVSIIESDFLTVDLNKLFTQADRRLKIIGNIPYNITSPILFKLIDAFQILDCAVLMTQKEVARRITARPATKDYGILSVISQTYARSDFLFTVKSGNFFPLPKVDSAVVRLKFYNQLSQIEDARLFRNLVRQVFNYRRKMLRNSLSRIFPKSVVNSLNPSYLKARPEDLSVETFKQLSNEIYQITGRQNG